MVVRKVRKPKVRKGRGSPGKSRGGRGSSRHLPSLLGPVYTMEKGNALCHDFPKVVPESPEDKERLLSLMKETNWSLNNVVLKALGKDRELAERVAEEGIPKDLYSELFSTLIGYGVPGWIAEGALRGAVTIIRQWRRTLRTGHIPKAKALRLYVRKEWYKPETGYLELPPVGLKFRVLGGNPNCKDYPIKIGWPMVIYSPAYKSFYLELVREVPPKERKLNVPLSYMLKQGLKRGWVLAVDINVNEIVVGNGKKELERRYPTLFTATSGLEPNRRPSVLCYGVSPKVCDTLEKLRDKYARLYDTLKRLKEKYPDYDPRNISKGPGRRLWLIIRKMSVLDKLYMREIAKDIVSYAVALGSPSEGIPYVIVLENLRGLQIRISEDSNRPREVKTKIRVMAYSKLARSIITLAKIYGVPYVFVDPRGTSTTCPKCGAKMVQVEDPVIGKRTMYCPNCGFKEDRDTLALINLTERAKRLLSSSL